jgi:hypothetical protein
MGGVSIARYVAVEHMVANGGISAAAYRTVKDHIAKSGIRVTCAALERFGAPAKSPKTS